MDKQTLMKIFVGILIISLAFSYLAYVVVFVPNNNETDNNKVSIKILPDYYVYDCTTTDLGGIKVEYKGKKYCILSHKLKDIQDINTAKYCIISVGAFSKYCLCLKSNDNLIYGLDKNICVYEHT
jgi:hypothetical protein